MKKILMCIFLSMVTIVLVSVASASGEDLDTETHDIVISAGDDFISVEESLKIQGSSNETYDIVRFWVQDEAEDVDIIINNNLPSCNSSGNDYICNISHLNITMDTSIQVTISYTLGKDVEEFTKTLTRNTTSMSVKFDDNIIYSGENLKSGTSFTLLLYKPAETPLAWYVVVVIVLLVVLLVVFTLYSFRKQKSLKIKEIAGESEELLNTKKTLLMSLLTDVEKQHRSKQISDDTYHKLKEQYKQQAVETMKKLEDMKSEIK